MVGRVEVKTKQMIVGAVAVAAGITIFAVAKPKRQKPIQLVASGTNAHEGEVKNPILGDQVKFSMGSVIGGEIVVGFRKDVSQADAEALLTKNNLTFQRAKQVNMGKVFFYEAGETFIVKVPQGQEKKWVETMAKEPSVYRAGAHMDSNKIMID